METKADAKARPIGSNLLAAAVRSNDRYSFVRLTQLGLNAGDIDPALVASKRLLAAAKPVKLAELTIAQLAERRNWDEILIRVVLCLPPRVSAFGCVL
jgi:hypothetical protein